MPASLPVNRCAYTPGPTCPPACLRACPPACLPTARLLIAPCPFYALTEIVQQVTPGSVDVIAAIGGDGTMFEVLQVGRRAGRAGGLLLLVCSLAALPLCMPKVVLAALPAPATAAGVAAATAAAAAGYAATNRACRLPGCMGPASSCGQGDLQACPVVS